MARIPYLPPEILRLIVDKLERVELRECASFAHPDYPENDFSSSSWPVHTISCMADVANARRSSKEMREAAWPIFGRILGSAVFTLTPRCMKFLEFVASHGMLSHYIETLTFSSGYFFEFSGRSNISEDGQAYHFVREVHNVRGGGMTATEKPHFMDELHLMKAWRACRREQERFCAPPRNAHIQSLVTVLKGLPKLRNLRTVYCWDTFRCAQAHKGCLKQEMRDKLPGKTRLLDQYDFYGPPVSSVNDHNPHLGIALRKAIIKSAVRLQSIVDLHPVLYEHDDFASLANLRRMGEAKSLQNLTTVSLSMGQPDEVASEQPDPTHVLQALFNGAPKVRNLFLHVEDRSIKGWFKNLAHPIRLEVLDLENAVLTELDLLAFATPALRQLRLNECALLNSSMDVLLSCTLQAGP